MKLPLNRDHGVDASFDFDDGRPELGARAELRMPGVEELLTHDLQLPIFVELPSQAGVKPYVRSDIIFTHWRSRQVESAEWAHALQGPASGEQLEPRNLRVLDVPLAHARSTGGPQQRR